MAPTAKLVRPDIDHRNRDTRTTDGYTACGNDHADLFTGDTPIPPTPASSGTTCTGKPANAGTHPPATTTWGSAAVSGLIPDSQPPPPTSPTCGSSMSGGFLIALDSGLYRRVASRLVELGASAATDDVGGEIVQLADEDGRLFTLFERVPEGTECRLRACLGDCT